MSPWSDFAVQRWMHMNEQLNLINSRLRAEALQRRAEAWRRANIRGGGSTHRVVLDHPPEDLVIRLARPDDGAALLRLAQLEGRPRPRRHAVLVAEVEGEVLAALWLDGGEVFADPFKPTTSLVQLLRVRAAQLQDPAEVQDPAAGRSGTRARLSKLLRGLRPGDASVSAAHSPRC